MENRTLDPEPTQTTPPRTPHWGAIKLKGQQVIASELFIYTFLHLFTLFTQ